MTNHEELLTTLERQCQVAAIKMGREHAELRSKLVKKYGEEPIERKEKQLKEKWNETNAG